MSCPPEKIVFDEIRGEYICTETGEVLEERIALNDNYHNVNFSSEILLRKHKEKKEKRSLDISIDKLISIALSKLEEKERDLFLELIDRIQKKDAAMIIAVYEYVLIKSGKILDDSLRQSLGISDYSVRERKKILRQMLKDYDKALDEIENNIAREVYEYLAKKNIITGYKAKKRMEILKKYLEDRNFMRKFIERKYALEILKSESKYSKKKQTERKYALMLI